MRLPRKTTAVALASMILVQVTPVLATTQNPMGYRLVTTSQAANLPDNHGTLGLNVASARQINSSGMTFTLMQVRGVRAGSPAARAGFEQGDHIIAVNGRVFPTATAFAAYLRSIPPGTRINIDYMPAGTAPQSAERVALVVGKPGQSAAQNADPSEHKGISTRTKLGLGAAAILGCYYFGCFSGSGSSR
jgi:S1-C subfamily serine protease